MTQAQILMEFSQLSVPQQLEIIQAALRIVTQHIQSVAPDLVANETHTSLVEAANLLLDDYREDKELTNFTVLDGAPVHV